MKVFLLNWGVQHGSVGAGRRLASLLTAKGDGIEEGIFRDNKCHFFREMVRNFIVVSALDACVVRRGRNCPLKCPSHTSITDD